MCKKILKHTFFKYILRSLYNIIFSPVTTAGSFHAIIKRFLCIKVDSWYTFLIHKDQLIYFTAKYNPVDFIFPLLIKLSHTTMHKLIQCWKNSSNFVKHTAAWYTEKNWRRKKVHTSKKKLKLKDKKVNENIINIYINIKATITKH